LKYWMTPWKTTCIWVSSVFIVNCKLQQNSCIVIQVFSIWSMQTVHEMEACREVVSICLHVSSPKLFNGFWLNLVLRIYTARCAANLMLDYTYQI
jgi:hypothetical protein